MLDLHCHILWHMDDGAKTMEKTIEMCRTAVENGISIVAATPHMTNLRQTDDFLYTRNRKITELNRLLNAEEIPLRICVGAEVYLNDWIFEADDELAELTLNRSRYLLCEYSLRPFDPEKAVLFAGEIVERGLVPLIAHPERYPTFHEYPDIVPELYDLGARFQVNADSLTGRIGEDVRDFAAEMLTNGFADVIATDAHGVNQRNNAMQEMQTMFPSEIMPEILRYTTETVPFYILKNEPLPRNPFRK